jgi:uncharacterized membrane protein
MRAQRWWPIIPAVLAVGLLAPAAGAQEAPVTGVHLLSPAPGVAVAPGKTVTFTLTIQAPERERVDLDVTGVPEGWTTTLRGAGAVITEVIVSEAAPITPALEVAVPADAAEGDYTITVVARGESGTDRLDLHLRVAAGATGEVTLTADFPSLKGASEAIFSFSLRLLNSTAGEIQFGLTAEGPSGWLVDAQPAVQARASTVTVGAGGSSSITVQADPPDNIAAGVYPITVRATGSGETAVAELTAEITGTYRMNLTTEDGRLNFNLGAGSPRELQMTLINTGTGALTGITFAAQPPADWTVVFAPDFIAQLAPGTQQQVVATVTAARDAIAGDYVIGVGSEANEASDQAELRATIETSTAWGIVGIVVILVALGGLALVFWRFGRR